MAQGDSLGTRLREHFLGSQPAYGSHRDSRWADPELCPTLSHRRGLSQVPWSLSSWFPHLSRGSHSPLLSRLILSLKEGRGQKHFHPLLCLGYSSSSPLISCLSSLKWTSQDWTPIPPPSKPCLFFNTQLRRRLPLKTS